MLHFCAGSICHLAAIILFRMDLFKPDRKNWKLTKFEPIKSMHLLRIGVPIGSQYITEMLAFSIGSFMMGWIGTNALAAHQVVMSLVDSPIWYRQDWHQQRLSR